MLGIRKFNVGTRVMKCFTCSICVCKHLILNTRKIRIALLATDQITANHTFKIPEVESSIVVF